MRNRFNQITKSKPKVTAVSAVSSIFTQQIGMKLRNGLALHNSGQLEQAKSIYEEILKLDPKHFDAMQLLGMLSAQTGQLDKALKLLADALKINAASFSVHNNFGNVLKELQRFDEALASFDRAIELKRDYSEAYYNRGIVLQEFQRFDDALLSYDKAIEHKSYFAEAYFNRGNVLKELHRFEEALASYDYAIEVKKDYAEAYSNRGLVLKEFKRLDEALASFDKAIELKSDYADAICNRGNVLQELNRLGEALASYNWAIDLQQNDAQIYSNRANVLKELGCFDEALVSYNKAIDLNRDFAQAHHNRSHALLLFGILEEGFLEYEWRWIDEQSSKVAGKQNFNQPLWVGNGSLVNKTILLYSEQGLGDTLQFCRYAQLVKGLGARVLLEVPKPLIALLGSLKGVDELLEKGKPFPDFDFQCPLMSLPLAFKTELNSIPCPTPYLNSDTEKFEVWKQRIGEKSKPRIGLVWSGSTIHKNDHNRSLALPDLVKHLPHSFDYFSLQKEVREGDKEALTNSKIKHYGEQLIDFGDTAALCDLMDLVICVDTSVAHLAGALGKKTWILLPYVPDWRWLIDRDDSPWYESVKLYRQGEDKKYKPVLERLEIDLKKVTV